MAPAGRELILGVSGSIAAYKAVYLLRELVRQGDRVTVVTTAHAERFVGALTWRTLSGRPVLTDLFDPQTPEAVEHVGLAERAQALVVAPATANLLAKAAHGVADDFLTTLLLAARCPVLMAPAMDGGMWDHPAVVANVRTLRERGVTVIEPEVGRSRVRARGQGPAPRGRDDRRAPRAAPHPRARSPGRARPRDLRSDARAHRSRALPLEPLVGQDGPRDRHGRASGAARRSSSSRAPPRSAPPPGAVYVPVQTAEEMREAALHHLASATIVIKAAAVADYRVARPSATKIKSKKDEGLTLELAPNPDILREIAAREDHRFVVGFAAETDDVRAHAPAKLAAKDIDLLVVNDVSRRGIGFDADDNEVMLLDRWGGAVELPRMAKLRVADAILDRILALRAAGADAGAR